MPNVFINGKHIGGCDDTVGLNDEGKLLPLEKDATFIIFDSLLNSPYFNRDK